MKLERKRNPCCQKKKCCVRGKGLKVRDLNLGLRGWGPGFQCPHGDRRCALPPAVQRLELGLLLMPGLLNSCTISEKELEKFCLPD